ncbi:hypothetical protein [Sphingomonas cavernae]|uniref:Uncharacterized protein n=1 Tax=Sphingomonas cavernae TaxID=2320861 RepID=A0A418WRZ0_9SPHN|nr:hypothetical protein [Sphingomonas cavernae]RJF93956.1 hypothetical protein D3876_06710 [Sphingomonas cavernae]
MAMMYLINEFDVQLDHNGQASLQIALPEPVAYAHAGQALVLIERLGPDGEGQAVGGVPIAPMVDGINAQNISTLPDVAVYAGAMHQGAQALLVGVTGQVGERFRIFVGWARRQINEARADLSCKLCRKALKAAINAALAAVGIPMPGDILGDVLGALLDGLALDGIAAFLKELFGEQIIDWLSDQLNKLLGLFRAIDALCRRLCEELDFCQP